MTPDAISAACWEALDAVLRGEAQVPGAEEAIERFSSRELALASMGRSPDGPLPQAGTAARTLYRSRARQIQRARGRGQQVRGITPASRKRLLEAARGVVGKEAARSLSRRGAEMAIEGTIRVSQAEKRVRMPARGRVAIPGNLMRPAVTAWRRGESELAGWITSTSFFIVYWAGDPEPLNDAQEVTAQMWTR